MLRRQITSNMIYDDIQLVDGGQRGCPPLYLLLHSLDTDMKGFTVVCVAAVEVVEVHVCRAINAVYSTTSRAMNSVEYTDREGIEWRGVFVQIDDALIMATRHTFILQWTVIIARRIKDF